MRKKASVPNRQYTQEFKAEAVRLALSIGGNAAAKRLGIPQSTMTNWARRSREGSSAASESTVMAVKRPVSELESETARLRRDQLSVNLDLQLLQKAAAYFANESR